MALEIQSSISGMAGALESQKAAAEELLKASDPAKLAHQGAQDQSAQQKELAQAVTGLGSRLDVTV